jgi:lipid-A-disaccharide synthase
MGFLRVLTRLPQFWRLLWQADRCFREERPDAVVLIDFPGFNWWIARRAKKHGIPVFYYGVPQMWAWAGWRVRKMRRLVDHVLCKLPFEQQWFQERGCEATYVGHPYFDEMEQQRLDASFLAEYGARHEPLVTILPGSRSQEVADNLHWFLKAAAAVHARVPTVRFAVAAFRADHAATARAMAEKTQLPIDVFSGRTPELIHLSHCTMACSGSVSLELLHHAKPTVVLYWVPRLLFWLVRRFLIRVKYITLVNLLADPQPFASNPTPYDPHSPGADRAPFPEYPTYEDRSEHIAAHVVEWLSDDDRYRQRVEQLHTLKQRFAQSGASERAADYILGQLAKTKQPFARREAA